MATRPPLNLNNLNLKLKLNTNSSLNMLSPPIRIEESDDQFMEPIQEHDFETLRQFTLHSHIRTGSISYLSKKMALEDFDLALPTMRDTSSRLLGDIDREWHSNRHGGSISTISRFDPHQDTDIETETEPSEIGHKTMEDRIGREIALTYATISSGVMSSKKRESSGIQHLAHMSYLASQPREKGATVSMIDSQYSSSQFDHMPSIPVSHNTTQSNLSNYQSSTFMSDSTFKPRKPYRKHATFDETQSSERNSDKMDPSMMASSNIDPHFFGQTVWQELSGMVEKLSPNKFRGWQSRWLYLYHNRLYYYKTSNIIPKGQIQLQLVDSISVTRGDTTKDIDSSVSDEKQLENCDDLPTFVDLTGAQPVATAAESPTKHFYFQIQMRGTSRHKQGRLYQFRCVGKELRNQWWEALLINWKKCQIDEEPIVERIRSAAFSHQLDTPENATSPKGGRIQSGINSALGMWSRRFGRNRSALSPPLSEDEKKDDRDAESDDSTDDNNSEQILKQRTKAKRQRRKASKRVRSADSRADMKKSNHIRATNTLTCRADILSIDAQSGDIILFTANCHTGQMIRVATSGEFDHIGMLFRFKSGELGVLEAMGATGVQIFNWTSFITKGWHSQYHKIVWRRLLVPTPELRSQIVSRLSRFVKLVVNRSYRNPLTTMIAMAAPQRRDSLSTRNEKRTFFCSELVSKAYKDAALLPDLFASTSYFPRHFEDSSGIVLMKGCDLSREIMVNFDCLIHNSADVMDPRHTLHPLVRTKSTPLTPTHTAQIMADYNRRNKQHDIPIVQMKPSS